MAQDRQEGDRAPVEAWDDLAAGDEDVWGVTGPAPEAEGHVCVLRVVRPFPIKQEHRAIL